MKTKNVDQAKSDAAAKKAKTSPSGMAPDRAHSGPKPTGMEPDVETEETFNNSPNNADAIGNKRFK